MRHDGRGDGEELSRMRLICAEYEEAIAKLQQIQLNQLDMKDRELSNAIDERDSLQDDVAAFNKSITDLHVRCRRAQSSIDYMRKNEKLLKDSITQYQSMLSQEQRRYQVLNKASTLLVKGANTEIEQAVSNTKYNAILQGELNRIRDQNQSLRAKLEQKNAKGKELTEICDELIANAHP